MEIRLNALRFRARHGVLPQERSVGGDFEVSLTLHIADSAAREATERDKLDGTADYAAVYARLREEMARPARLLEHLADRVAKAVLADFPLVCAVEAEVAKCVPPIAGFCGKGVAVRLRRERKLAILDFDGTLADTSKGIVRTMTETFREMGLPAPTPEAVRQTIGLPLGASIAKLAGTSGAELAAAVGAYRRIWEETGTENVSLFKGVAETLEELHGAGVLTAIATSRGHASAEALCRKLGIRPYIDTLLAADDVKRGKPHPEAALRLLRRYHLPPSQAWVAGDTAYDIAMGAAAGCHTLGVTYGNHTRGQLREAGAEHTADDFTELRRHILGH